MWVGVWISACEVEERTDDARREGGGGDTSNSSEASCAGGVLRGEWMDDACESPVTGMWVGVVIADAGI